jgi:hypothetical protein
MAAMPVLGAPEYFASYRSELAGLLGISLVTVQIMATCGTQHHHILLGCDGEATHWVQQKKQSWETQRIAI